MSASTPFRRGVAGALAAVALALGACAATAQPVPQAGRFAPEDRHAALTVCPLLRHFDEWWIADAAKLDDPDPEELTQCARAGRAGDARAQLALAHYFVASARHVAALREAQQWARASSESGFPPASLLLAILRLYSPVEELRDTAAGLAALDRAVAAGYAPAGQVLAEIRLGAARNRVERDAALHLLIRSAELGWAESATLLGGVYAGRLFDTAGAAPDLELARRWYARAADLGDAEAQFQLGELHRLGQGGPRNARAAVRLYRRAAERGHLVAIDALATAHRLGAGTVKNRAEAARLYLIAAEGGFANAQINLAALYRAGAGVARDDRQAAKWLNAAAELGSAAGQYQLGRMYELGRVGEDGKNIEAALQLYARAALQGDTNAIFALARLRIEPARWPTLSRPPKAQ